MNIFVQNICMYLNIKLFSQDYFGLLLFHKKKLWGGEPPKTLFLRVFSKATFLGWEVFQNYAQWHSFYYAQHVAHQVAQYCESYAQ